MVRVFCCEHIWELPVSELVPEGQCGFDSSSMENAGMLSNVVVISGGVSIPSTSKQ